MQVTLAHPAVSVSLSYLYDAIIPLGCYFFNDTSVFKWMNLRLDFIIHSKSSQVAPPVLVSLTPKQLELINNPLYYLTDQINNSDV